MSKAHKGSKLSLKGLVHAVDFNSTHFDYNHDSTGISNGKLIEPVGTPVYTMRPNEGKFGGGVAIEEGTTNIITSPLEPETWYSYNSSTYGFISEEVFMTMFETKGYRKTVTSSDYRATRWNIYWSTPTDLTQPLTFSIYARANGNARLNLNYQGTDVNGSRIDKTTNILLTDKWEKYTTSYVLANEGFVSVLSYMKVYISSEDGTSEITGEITMPQAEEKSFATSFVNGSRGGGLLEYPLKFTRNSTVSVWTKVVDNDMVRFPICANDGSERLEVLFAVDGTVHIGTSDDYYTTGVLFVASEYNHICMSILDNSVKLYLNGEIIKTASLTVLPKSDIGIGRRTGGSYLSSVLSSDLYIENSIATGEEIESWYLAQKPFHNPYDFRAFSY